MSKEVLVDPFVLERIADSRCLETFWQEPTSRKEEIMEMRKLVEELEPDDRQIYDEYYIELKTQTELADKYEMTQGNISHWIALIERRIKFLSQLPEVDWFEKLKLLKEWKNEKVAHVIKLYVITKCQTETARMMSESLHKPYLQCQVHTTTKNVIDLYRAHGEENTARYLELLMENGQILHRRK